MLIDITPLRRHREYRLLYTGQFVSSFGSFLTMVALPVQIYDLTKSSAIVGMLGAVQLVPLALTALWGGAFADAFDRRRMLLGCETILLCGSLALLFNAALPHPSVVAIFAIAACMSATIGFHSPALESLVPRLVTREDIPAVSALGSLRGSTAAIAGPALAGVCIAAFGLPCVFGLDAVTFLVSLTALCLMKPLPPTENAPVVGLASIIEGLRYGLSRRELVGTYVVDIVAMTFAMPMAVFPALAAQWGGSHDAGYLYAALSVGALLTTLTSGWTRKVQHHGAAVVIAAALWGVAIAALGFANSLPVAIACLMLAGAADMVSGLFRMTIWNETIPPQIRGRMAGIEQLSYMSGPLLGNARAGLMAEQFGLARSITSGGVICVVLVLTLVPVLPAFWRYRRPPATGSTEPVPAAESAT